MENESKAVQVALSNLGPREGEKNARLTISVNITTRSILIWDATEKFIDFSFDDAPYVIAQITDPEIPRNKEYYKKLLKP